MKRFITYLYEYNQGHKEKNTGFIRVDIRGELANLEICVRNYIRTTQVGCVYGLVESKERREEKKLVGLELCEIVVQKGQCDKMISLEKNTLVNTPYTIHDVVGIAICFEEGGYLASCWKDMWTEEIASAAFDKDKKEDIEVTYIESKDELENLEISKEKIDEVKITSNESEVEVNHWEENEIEAVQSKYTIYKKIEPHQIRELKSSNWHLGNNSFLLHGAVNYGFLFLKKEVNEEGEKLWLGVPGYYEKQEMLMAVLFGFLEFEPIPKVAVDMEMNKESRLPNIEKNQEPKTGLFGGWFVLLDE